MKPDDIFTPSHPLSTAVLFLIFNRLDTTKQVFESIRRAKPPRLYIAADGPRDSKVGEMDKVEGVRKYVLEHIDWPCKTVTLFRKGNLGCKNAVSQAITWFFSQEPQGIILEDDCLPSPGFFFYCEELLVRYKLESKVWHIAGANVLPVKGNSDSYYFSKFPGIWGWATWADRWSKYDVDLSSFSDASFIQKKMTHRDESRFWESIFKKMKAKSVDTWDYQWIFTLWKHGGIAITPNTNQIANIGFNSEGSHTQNPDSILAKLVAKDIGPLVHPREIEVNEVKDRILANQFFSDPSFLTKVFKRLKAFCNA